MKVAGQNMKKGVSILWWFRMAIQLCFLLGASSQNFSFRRASRRINSVASLPVNLITMNHRQQVVIENGIVSVTLSKPEGFIIAISYNGMDNVLEAQNEIDNRGYLDVVWNEPEQSGTFERIQGTVFSVIIENEDIAEVSFLRTWTASMQGKSVPMNIDQRYILRRGDSGFYSYAIFERPNGLPAVEIDQIRIVYKLNQDRFKYMAISDTRQRMMPSASDRKRGKPLAYPEAVLLTHPSNPQFKGEVDDKYQYSSLNTENSVHGWTTVDSEAPIGFWLITPSNEFRNGGPTKQDLTSHVGPVTLSMFVSTHYAGKGLTMAFGEGEPYKKVFGPVFTYLNSAPNDVNFRSLWSEAKQQLSNEVQRWPYDFPLSNDFFPPNERGTVTGCLQVQERGQKSQYPNNAYIGLALPGEVGSWQKESKGYQFWSRTDGNGNFVIKNIVPGIYSLYAWVPGFIGDYIYHTTITIIPGSNINLGSLVYNPPRNGSTLWEIGIPDRSAAEFYVPNPNPKLMNNLYKNDNADKFRQYGLWLSYADLYPPNYDLAYTIGVDHYSKDWFFAHVTRSVGSKGYKPTTWKIIFELQNKISIGFYTLQLALASANEAEVQVRFNDPNANPPHFTTGLIGEDNAIARHGIQGLHKLYSISVASNLLVQGKNTIFLTQPRAISAFQGVMYDYIRLESPPI